ncbi:MAG TPA: hypothetical protein VGV35_20520, partial [Bryobacteraceae bacterium]|nr:hypothetical protein [Bryobacteraceae bacterium]
LGVTTLNPLMLDFMVAARGYGIAVSGLTYAILALLDYLRATDGGRRSLYWAALGIYVSIGSNLSALIPCAMLMFSFLLIVAAARGVKRALLECSLLAMPVAAFLTAIYFVFPLHSANREHFYVGFPDWWQSFRNLIQVSFYHAGYIGDPRGVPPVVSAYLTVVAVVTGALLLWIAARWFRGIAALRRGGTLTESAFLLTAGAMWGSIAILFLAHHLLGLLYPVDRTGLYFLALMPIAVMTGGGRWMPISVFASAMVLIAFACQWNTRFFYVWRFDADTKEIMRVLEQRVGKAAGPVRLGISWPLDPSISFYRATRGDTWMAPVDRRGPDGQYDYYVITPPMTDLKLDDRPVLAKRSLTTIYEGPVSKTVLAIPPP